MKIRTFIRTIALILVFTLLIQVMPVSAISISNRNIGTETENQSAGETVNIFSYTDALSATDETILYEVEELREGSVKHFRLTDGSMVAAIYDLPVHEQSSDGTWVDIDNTIVSGSDNEGNSSLNIGNRISFANKAKNGKLLTIKTDYGKIRWSLNGITNKVKAAAYTAPEVEANNTKMAAKSISGIIRYEDVMPDVDLEYQMLANYVKENIILHSPTAAQSFTFTLDVGNKMSAKLENNCVVILNEKGEVVRTISAPYMSDAAESVSTGITLSLASNKKSYTVTLTPDMEWLLDESRTYPVAIDPIIDDGKNVREISSTSVISSRPNSSEMYSFGAINVGRESSSYQNVRGAIRFTLPTTLKESDMVISAYLKLTQRRYDGATGGVRINAHRITSDLPISSLTWNKLSGNYDTMVLDNQIVTGATEESDICWDITSTVKSWYLEGNNYGLALISTTENSTYKYATFYTPNHPEATPERLPSVIINYLNQEGMEDYLTYHNAGSSTMGSIAVGDFNGNLIYAYTDLSMTGNYMPVTIQHIYNHSQRANATASGGSMHYGIGMRLNISQRIEEVTKADIKNLYPYSLTDADGTVHYFSPKKDSNGTVIPNEYVKEFDKDTTLKINDDETYTLSDKSTTVYKFTRYGYLKSVTDKSNNKTMTITYDGSLMKSISDGLGRTTTFTFDSSNYLTKITDPAGRSTTYEYTNGCLTKITRPDGTTVKLTYTYTDGTYMLTGIEDIDNSKITVGYHTNSPHRVSTLTEYGTQGGEGEKLTWTYTAGETTVTDRDGNSETMMFDNAGHTICILDGEGNAVYGKYANTEDENKHSLNYQSQMQSTVTNYLKNHHFNSGTGSWGIYGTSSSGTFGQSTTQKYEGNSAHFVNNNSSAYFGMYQNVSVPDVAGQTLTLSAYMAVDTTQPVTPEYVHMSIQYQTTDGVWTGGLNAVPITGSDWQRYSCTVKIPENALNDTVKVVIRLNYCGGGLFVDNVQLEPGAVANRYNMLENGHIAETTGKTSIYGWTNTQTRTSTDMTVAGRSGSGFKIEGVPGKSIYLYQDINVSGQKGDTFVVGGWGKGTPLPFSDIFNSIEKRHFGFMVKFYTDSENSQDEILTFDAKSPNWQYLMGCVSAPCDYQFIRVLMMYKYQDNTCIFDDIQMYREEYGTRYEYDDSGRLISATDSMNRTTKYEYVSEDIDDIKTITYADGTTSQYEYDSETRNITASVDANGKRTTYSYDSSHNLTETVMTAGDETLRSSKTAYYNGYVSYVTDVFNNKTVYNYEKNTGTLNKVTDAAGTVTNYTYNDDNDYLTKVSSAGSEVDYTYDDGKLTSITHNTDTADSGDVTYTFEYDQFGNTTKVKVGNQALITHTYGANNGLLTESTYGNGVKYTPTYDSLDRISSVSYNGSEKYRWEYGADGRVGLHEDLVNNVKWRYEYKQDGSLTSASGSNGERFTYAYDTATGKLISASVSDGISDEPKTTTYNYSDHTNEEDANLIESVVLPIAAVTYDYDKFYRASYDVEVSNADILTTDYTFRNSADGTSTSMVVETMTNVGNDWDTKLTYTYDDNGNIETISENDVLKATYYYDDLNQLEREDNVWLGKTIAYTYDNGGNIQLVEEYAYTSGALDGLTATNSYTYLYGDSNWIDKLTSYNGNTITYDEIGNPINYYNGYTFTWQNGRQLAGISGETLTISYKYDADGIRTSKIVNGVTTTYTLEGSNIVKETNGTDTLWYYYDASDSLIGFEYNGTPYFYVKNIQGDIIAITDATGTQVVTYLYDSWGKVLDIDGTLKNTIGVINPFRYRGYYYDEETGLYYLNSRYYDPNTKRFVNSDFRINNSQGVLGGNTFAYCINNPVVLADDNGTKPYDMFDSMSEAAADFARCYNALSIKENKEYGSAIYAVTIPVLSFKFTGFVWTVSTSYVTKYYYTKPNVGKDNGVIPNFLTYIMGSVLVSTVHTHGAYDPSITTGNDKFSASKDIHYADLFNMPIFLANPKGELRLYIPGGDPDGTPLPINDIPFDPNHPER